MIRTIKSLFFAVALFSPLPALSTVEQEENNEVPIKRDIPSLKSQCLQHIARGLRISKFEWDMDRKARIKRLWGKINSDFPRTLQEDLIARYISLKLHYLKETSALKAEHKKQKILGELLISFIENDYFNLAQHIIDNGYNLNHQTKDNYSATPLFAAVNSFKAPVSQRIKWANYLLEKGADVNIRNSEKSTPLHKIITLWIHRKISYRVENQLPLLKFLLTKGAEVNTQTQGYKETPLISALELGDVEVVQLLLQHGADPLIGDELSNKNALRYVTYAENGIM